MNINPYFNNLSYREFVPAHNRGEMFKLMEESKNLIKTFLSEEFQQLLELATSEHIEEIVKYMHSQWKGDDLIENMILWASVNSSEVAKTLTNITSMPDYCDRKKANEIFERLKDDNIPYHLQDINQATTEYIKDRASFERLQGIVQTCDEHLQLIRGEYGGMFKKQGNLLSYKDLVSAQAIDESDDDPYEVKPVDEQPPVQQGAGVRKANQVGEHQLQRLKTWAAKGNDWNSAGRIAPQNGCSEDMLIAVMQKVCGIAEFQMPWLKKPKDLQLPITQSFTKQNKIDKRFLQVPDMNNRPNLVVANAGSADKTMVTVQRNGEGDLAKCAIDFLQANGPEKLYCVRVGEHADSVGHYHLAFFNHENKCWELYSSEKNHFTLSDAKGHPTERGQEVLNKGPRYSFSATEIQIQHIDKFFAQACVGRLTGLGYDGGVIGQWNGEIDIWKFTTALEERAAEYVNADYDGKEAILSSVLNSL